MIYRRDYDELRDEDRDREAGLYRAEIRRLDKLLVIITAAASLARPEELT